MVPGIDVSHYNGVIDWAKVADSGVKFAYIKCTDGPTWEDPRWGFNTVGARRAGIKIGSYHFLRRGVTGDQLTQFIDKLNTLVPDDLPPCLDVELPGELPVLECAQRIADELKRVPVIYTNRATAIGLPTEVSAYPLWLADWGSSGIDGTPPWPVWTFWQYTDKGTVPGISGDIDLDWFNGDDTAFAQFIEESKGLTT